MEHDSHRQGKILYLGLPFLLLLLYLAWIPSPSVNRIVIQGDLGYIANGYEFEILRLTPQGLIFPSSSINLAYKITDFLVTRERAFVITNNAVIHIIDINNPFDPIKLASFSTPGTPHSMVANNDLAYIAEQTGSVRMVNIRNPAQLVEVGLITNLGRVLDIDRAGNMIYIARGELGVDIYDANNPAEPALKGHYDAGGSATQVEIQTITQPDGEETVMAKLVLAENIIQVVDFTNPQQPILLYAYGFGSTEIKQATLNNNVLFVALGRGGLLISRINNDGTLEQLANIRNLRNTLGFAQMGNSVFLTAGFEGLRAFDITNFENIRPVGNGYSKFWSYKIWIGFLSVVLLLLWLAFFAQFVLPVRSFRQRQKIFNRLITFLLGGHGPAIFVENGRKVERPGESEKKGPGVAWLDTASAAAIRTATKFKEAIGPGVHFTEKGEFLAGPIDLHIQVDPLGPSEGDKPFKEQTDDQSDETYKQIQIRRKSTSALTRDGIEVVPNITVVFRVDTQPAEGRDAGSRFGYRVGLNEIDKEIEKKNKQAIFKAIAGEGIDPTVPLDASRYRVAWNQLPGRLAVDVWREYAAKFTLDELFTPTKQVAVPPPSLPEPKSEEVEAIKHPIRTGTKRETLQEAVAAMLHVLNGIIANFITWLEVKEKEKSEEPATSTPPGKPAKSTDGETQNQTALQVINEMVKKRLTQREVFLLSDTGEPQAGSKESIEYDLLCKRGLKVLGVSISNLRFREEIEKHLVDNWSANWFSNAKSERERIDRRRGYVEINGEEEGAGEYVHALARHVVLQKPDSTEGTLRALLMRTRLTIVRNDQLQRRMSTERQDIEDILRWLENGT